MQTDAAKWKPAAFREIVRKSARSLNVRNTTLMVLNEFLAVLNYKTGLTRMGTPRLCERLGREEKSVKLALQELRSLGLLYYEGRAGRGKTALYGLGYTREAVADYNQRQQEKERGVIFTPLCVGRYLEKGGIKIHKGGNNIPQRGDNNSPPSSIVSIYQGEGIDPASRGAVPDAPDGGCTVEPVLPAEDRPKRPLLAGETPYQAIARWDREDAEALRAGLEL